ncbi:MAG: hypothetical protein EBT20_21710, partial [Alphaproteobacteria bacterium]|nr:hypothetical protein [Alphaproteobacteria bacterium]
EHDNENNQLIFNKLNETIIHLQKRCSDIDLPIYSSKILIDELSLFHEWYLKGLDFKQNKLEEIYSFLLTNIEKQNKKFVHRDFHCRNLLIQDDQICLIDFQDALIGPITYDIGSGAQATGSFTGLAAGGYTVTITDANGCTDDVPVTIAEPTPVVGALDAATDADCNAAATGAATVSASGGTSPYSFDIGSGPQATGDFTGLAAGSYTVNILDANNCPTSVPVVIAEPDVLVIGQDAVTDATCGDANGAFTVSATGGTTPYTFDIGSGPQASGTFSTLPAGSYNVTVTDANNCTDDIVVTIDDLFEVI